MTTISTTSSANQYGLQQLSSVMALKNVAQAEQVAQSLKARADDAQRVVDIDRENARALFVQSNQAQVKAEDERQMLNTANSMLQSGSQLSNAINHAVVKTPIVSTQNAISSPATVNSQSQTIGTIINIKV